MLSDGEFHINLWKDGVEVWVTQMGPLMNMNTAFVDRENGVVAIIDPYDAESWSVKLQEEGLEPTHLLYTHTHRDHAAGYPGMIERYPSIEVWGHEDARGISFSGKLSLLTHGIVILESQLNGQWAIFDCQSPTHLDMPPVT